MFWPIIIEIHFHFSLCNLSLYSLCYYYQGIYITF